MTSYLEWRNFLLLLVVAVACGLCPLATHAQPTIPTIGVLSTVPFSAIPNLGVAFHRGLRDTGFAETKNLAIEYRSAQYEKLPDLAADLVQRRVAVIVAFGPPTALAAKKATTAIPIVFISGGDIVKSGLVNSLSRPGGNATGVNLFTQAVEAKKLDILNKLMPPATMMAFLMNPANPAAAGKTKEMQEAAAKLGRQLHVVNARNEIEIDNAFMELGKLRVGSLVVGSDPFFNDSSRFQIVRQAARFSIPAIYGQREYTLDGGLISYGTSLAEAYRQAGVYTGAILKGEQPANLPVLQPTRFELVINLKTAKELGVEIPPTLLAIADEVVD